MNEGSLTPKRGKIMRTYLVKVHLLGRAAVGWVKEGRRAFIPSYHPRTNSYESILIGYYYVESVDEGLRKAHLFLTKILPKYPTLSIERSKFTRISCWCWEISFTLMCVLMCSLLGGQLSKLGFEGPSPLGFTKCLTKVSPKNRVKLYLSLSLRYGGGIPVIYPCVPMRLCFKGF